MIKISLTELSQDAVFKLLSVFDGVFTPTLSEELDLHTYSVKLSQYGHFLLAQSANKEAIDGFIAYYLNPEGHFAYITLIAVSSLCQHQGIGHQMLGALESSLDCNYSRIILEVRKANHQGHHFYLRNGFIEAEDRGEKWLMIKQL